MIDLDQSDRHLFAYALFNALAALIGHARRFGRGWYHFVDGELAVVAEVHCDHQRPDRAITPADWCSSAAGIR